MGEDILLSLNRLGTLDLDSVHQAVFAGVVVERGVLAAAIVPKGDRALAPFETAGERILRRMFV